MSEYIMYLRKSRQDDINETVEEVLQKHEIILQEYALTNYGYRIPNKDIYREVVSGETIDDRPQINKVLKRIESESIKGVLVVDVQRLTRGDLLDCGRIEHTFRYTNTLIITPSKIYDLSDKYDRKFCEMELTRGSDYLDYTKEILNRGRLASIKRGNYIHSVAPYGYDKVKIDKRYTLKPNPSESIYVPMIFDLYLKGYGQQKIADEIERLGAKPRNIDHFTQGTIKQILNNPVYIGKLKVHERVATKVVENGKLIKKRKRTKGYEIVDGIHEPLIDMDTWNATQEKIGSTPRTKNTTTLYNPYATILKCGHCGYSIQVSHPSGKRYPRLRCRRGKYCENQSIRISDFTELFIKALKDNLRDFETKASINVSDEKESRETLLNELEKQIKEIDIKLNNICDYLESGVYTIDMFVARKNKLEEEKESKLNAIESIKKESATDSENQTKIYSLHKAIDLLADDEVSALTKNTFLKSFIERIEFKKNGDDIQIDIFLK